jgi:hypothetical protein
MNLKPCGANDEFLPDFPQRPSWLRSRDRQKSSATAWDLNGVASGLNTFTASMVICSLFPDNKTVEIPEPTESAPEQFG